MNLSLEKLSKYGFNQKALTERDFYRICEMEGVEVIEDPRVTNIFYMTFEGRPFIVLGNSTKHRGVKRLFAMFHELAHHFLHSQRHAANAFYFGLVESKQEFEADAFAAIALIPARDLGKPEILDEYPRGFARKIYNDRIRLGFLDKL